MDRKQHWQNAYEGGPTDVSWYQPRPVTSLAFISATRVAREGGIIDVGGGASTLVDHLLDDGYSPIGILDLSGIALCQARARLGCRVNAVEWFEGDVTSFAPPHRFAVWDDRAVFHFLTEAADRCAYMSTLRRTLQPNGHIVIATFAPDGPAKCSGLPVMRYDEATISAELGSDFVLRDSLSETHVKPWRTEQRFAYFRFERIHAVPR